MLGIVFGLPLPDDRDEFTRIQQAQDRAGWIGRGCTLPFDRDELAGGNKGNPTETDK